MRAPAALPSMTSFRRPAISVVHRKQINHVYGLYVTLAARKRKLAMPPTPDTATRRGWCSLGARSVLRSNDARTLTSLTRARTCSLRELTSLRECGLRGHNRQVAGARASNDNTKRSRSRISSDTQPLATFVTSISGPLLSRCSLTSGGSVTSSLLLSLGWMEDTSGPSAHK